MYQVNINIQAGSDFSQTFYLTNPDKTPQDLDWVQNLWTTCQTL